GDLCAAGAHARERLMAGRINEHDLAAVFLDLIRADMLRDAAGLLLGHVRQAYGVEQGGLAMVYVTHNSDHGRALHLILLFLRGLNLVHGFYFEAHGCRRGAELPRQLGGQLGIERLVDGGEDVAVDEFLDHQAGFHVQLLGKLFYGDAFRDGDLAIDRRWARWGFAPHRP